MISVHPPRSAPFLVKVLTPSFQIIGTRTILSNSRALFLLPVTLSDRSCLRCRIRRERPFPPPEKVLVKGKPPNYSKDEDFLISCAYVNVSVDPIKGVGQKADTFWTRVHENFLILSQKHFSDHDLEMPFTTNESIEQRWKKKISKFVQLWNKFSRQL
jgi:hypothetical protein